MRRRHNRVLVLVGSLLFILNPIRVNALPTQEFPERTSPTSIDLEEILDEQNPLLQPPEPSDEILESPSFIPSEEDGVVRDIDNNTIPLRGFNFSVGNNSANAGRITVFNDPQRDLSEIALSAIKQIIREEIWNRYPEWQEGISESLKLENLNLRQLSGIREAVRTQQQLTLERVQEIINRGDGSDDLLQVEGAFKFQLPIDLTFEDLLKVRSAITQYYLEKGYINSFAFIPEQSFSSENGVVEIRIVEGKLSEPVDYNVTSSREDFNREDFKKYMMMLLEPYLEEGRNNQVLNQNRLEDALRLLQQDARIGSITARLEQTEALNVSILRINAQESAPPPIAQLQFNSNNNRSPSVGSIQLQPQLRLHLSRLFDSSSRLQDQLDIAYTFTEGTDNFEISYVRPLRENLIDETLEISYRTAYSQPLGEPFNQLDILSYVQQFDVRYARLLSLSLSEKKTIEIIGSFQGSDSAVSGFPIPLSEDADANGRTRIAAARLAFNFTQRNTQQVLFLRPELSFGSNTSIDSGAFLIARLDGQWIRRLGDMQFVLRGRAQIAISDLPALEQFGIGGRETVRGYRQDFLLTDNALLGSAELRIPVLSNPDLFFIPFLDFGTGWNHSGDNNSLSPSTLWSTGLGLQLEISDRFSARFDWGIPLVSVPTDGNSLQENGFYFSVETTLITW